jgi:hypothetical protein
MKPLEQGSSGQNSQISPAVSGFYPRKPEALGQAPNTVRQIDRVPAVQIVFGFEKVIDDICNMPWERLGEAEILRVAMAYYYFSVQFRESLEGACRVYPDDEKLKDLSRGECNTSNLSPFEGVAADGEAMNHDEFMRRLLTLQPMGDVAAIERAGAKYLAKSRAMDDHVMAMSIASYEDGGLQSVFSAMLRAPSWTGAGQRAFRHFLEKHIEFDSDSDGGHGALSRHIPVDDSILPLWAAFEDILRCAVPAFARHPAVAETSPAE